jgi:4'-phosphopantetheinyl transferase
MPDMSARSRDAVLVSWLDPQELPERAAGMLDPDERMRVDASRDPGTARRLAAAFVLLRCTVALLSGRPPQQVTVRRRCPHCSAPHGRPELPGSSMGVSVSHAGDRVAVAVNVRGPVGIDIEIPRARPLSRALLRRALTAAEREYLLGVPEERRKAEFLRAWTAKEAILKATGEGLHGGPDRIDLDLLATPVRLRAWAGSAARAGTVALAELDLGGDRAGTVATLGAGTISLTQHHGRGLVERTMTGGPRG